MISFHEFYIDFVTRAEVGFSFGQDWTVHFSSVVEAGSPPTEAAVCAEYGSGEVDEQEVLKPVEKATFDPAAALGIFPTCLGNPVLRDAPVSGAIIGDPDDFFRIDFVLGKRPFVTSLGYHAVSGRAFLVQGNISDVSAAKVCHGIGSLVLFNFAIEIRLFNFRRPLKYRTDFPHGIVPENLFVLNA